MLKWKRKWSGCRSSLSGYLGTKGKLSGDCSQPQYIKAQRVKDNFSIKAPLNKGKERRQ